MKYIWIFIPIFLFGSPSASLALEQASFHFVPVSFLVSENEIFEQSVVVSTPHAVNAVSGEISFPNQSLEVVSIDTGASVVDFWVSKPAFSNVSGAITFEGVILNPGFSGSIGNIVDVTYRAKNTGTGEIYFISGSALANDGKGTNILEGLDRAAISVANGEVGLQLPNRQTFPQKFSIDFLEFGDFTEPTRSFRLLTDGFARIDFYEIVIDGMNTLIWPGDNENIYKTPPLGPGQHSITVTAVDYLGRIRSDSEIFEIRPLSSLLLVDLPRRAYMGASPWFCRLTSIIGGIACLEELVIEGKAFPNAEVAVRLQGETDSVNYSGIAAASGFFSIPVGGSLGSGAYEVYAQAADERGAKTEEQKVVSLVVDDRGGSSGGLPTPVTLFVVFVVIGGAWYLYSRLMKERIRVQKETFEARMALREGFGDVSDDVSRLKDLLAKAERSPNSLTEKDKQVIEDIEAKIKRGKEEIEREIEDIDDTR